jgi:hypothetical protein
MMQWIVLLIMLENCPARYVGGVGHDTFYRRSECKILKDVGEMTVKVLYT